MNSHTLKCIFTLFLTTAIWVSSVWAKKPTQEVTLTEKGKALEAQYTKQLDSLKAELTKQLPKINDAKKTAFDTARKSEKLAEEAFQVAQKNMGKLGTAKALIGHAKGKWIGGADRGIKAANAKLAAAKTDAERKAAQKELEHWQQNRKDGEQALKERTANYEKELKNKVANEKALKASKEALASAKIKTLQTVKDLKITNSLTSDKLDAKLTTYVVLLEATPRKLAAFAQQSDKHEKLVQRLLSSPNLLVQMAVADGAKDGNYGRAMEIYDAILKSSTKAKKGELQRLALAISLEHATPISQRNATAKKDAPAFVDPVKRYHHYEKAYLNNELDPAFKYLSTWDYRMVVNGHEPDEILAWGRETLRNYRPDHITTKDYRWRYVAAVRSDIRYGSQDNKHDKPELQFFQNILMNGGVCGRRAFFGRFMLRAFGIPTTARPQRGHAALAHWTPKGWVICLGGGWGSGWTKTRYDRDLDFLANTQARMTGEPFMQVKRAQWMGDVAGEPRVFGFISRKQPSFWYAASLYIQKDIIESADAKTLAAVGVDIAEANVTKEKVELTKVAMTDEDRKVTFNNKGVITIPATATSQPTKSAGGIIFMNSYHGGKQLHISRNGNKTFTYTFEVPTAGNYNLTARVVTPSWQQYLQLNVNQSNKTTDLTLPHTVGMWEETKPIVIKLEKGKNTLTFTRKSNGHSKGVSIKQFTLTPAR